MPPKIRDIIARLEADGWVQVRQTGSHHPFRHPQTRGTITVAGHPGDHLHSKREAHTEGLEVLMRYPVIIETGPEGKFSAYAPDVPGCVAAAATREEVERLMQEALRLHLATLAELPQPSDVLLVEI